MLLACVQFDLEQLAYDYIIGFAGVLMVPLRGFINGGRRGHIQERHRNIQIAQQEFDARGVRASANGGFSSMKQLSRIIYVVHTNN